MALKSFNKIVKRKSFRRFFSSEDKITTAGIIGDEILKGEVADTNSTFIALELHKLGLQLRKISVIGDIVKEVADEVHNFSKTYDYVITSGGIGPTHDDITYEAVALAFQKKLIFHPELKEICVKFYNTTDINSPGMKLALIPQTSRLNYTGINGVKLIYPTVSVNNVYMFPGVPELLVKSFSYLKEALFKSDKHFYSKCVYFNVTEEKIAEALNVLVKKNPDVQFGSYPKLHHCVYKVKVTIESFKEESTMKAYHDLLALVPKTYIVEIRES